MSKTRHVLGALLLAGLLPSCNNSGGSKAPRVSTIPLQSVGGGATFVLDVSTCVEDDTETATYAVTAGGGSFTGSVYSHVFPTLGTYTVSFQVTDFRGENSTASFSVKVTSAELGVVRNGTGVSLFDFATSNFVSAIQDDGQTKAFKAALTSGGFVLEVSTTGQKDLWLHDPNFATTDVFAGDSSQDEVYVLKTTTDQVLFMRGAAPSRSLHLYNPTTKMSTTIGVTTEAAPDLRDAVRNTSDQIYFEGATAGLADIYLYDVSLNQTSLVSAHARDEDIVSTLPNGGLVFRRKGDGGEWDLLYYAASVGVVEIGTDLGTTKNLESKDFRATTTDSRVVFETTDAGNDHDLYIWNPGTGQTVVIAQGTDVETFLALTGSGRIVYGILTGGTNADMSWFDPATNNQGTIANTADGEAYNATLTNGDVIYSRSTGGGGVDLYHWDESGGSASAFPGAGSTSTDQLFKAVLSNDDVVYTTGPDIYFFRHSAGTSTSVTTATGTESYAGQTAGGDFVISLVSGADTFLYLWDSSATSSVAITTTAGVSTYQAVSSAGTILFARTATGPTTSELFSFVPATTTTTQVTTNEKNDTVDAVIQAVVN